MIRHLGVVLFSAASFVASSSCVGVGDSIVGWEVRGSLVGQNGNAPGGNPKIDLELLRTGETIFSTSDVPVDEAGRFMVIARDGLACSIVVIPIPFPITRPSRSLGPRPDEIRMTVKTETGQRALVTGSIEDRHVVQIRRLWFVPIYGILQVPPILVEFDGRGANAPTDVQSD